MDTTIDRQHTCAFTGHRPERLGFLETGVIAIDACTAFSGKVNVLILEDEPNSGGSG